MRSSLASLGFAGAIAFVRVAALMVAAPFVPPLVAPLEAATFDAGSNTWEQRDGWPLHARVTRRRPYVQADHRLAFTAPTPSAPSARGFDAYVSDLANRVPYPERPITPANGQRSTRSRRLVDEQRVRKDRTDVVGWQTEPLDKDVVIAGEITANLFASTTGSDADWVVKRIDAYPDRYDADAALGGYQLMAANHVFRGRFRKGFEHPAAITPNHVDEDGVDLHTQDYKFRAGHRIMVQIQSSRLPLIERNPQTFVPSVFEAKDSDFKAQPHEIYRALGAASYVQVSVVGAGGDT